MNFLQKSMKPLGGFYGSQLQDFRSNLTGNDPLKDLARVNLAAVESKGLRKSLSNCSAPPTLSSIHNLQKYMSTYFHAVHQGSLACDVAYHLQLLVNFRREEGVLRVWTLLEC